jgi:hypothetical protein
MNMTTDREFQLAIPAGRESALDLASGKTIAPGPALKVAPRSTVALWLGP